MTVSELEKTDEFINLHKFHKDNNDFEQLIF